MKINNKGFSLIEIMTALGILGALTVVIMQAQKSSEKNAGDLKITSEVNNLVQILTSELNRVETCNKNLEGLFPTDDISDIKNKAGQPIISEGQEYGGGENAVRKIVSEFKITTITTSYVAPKYSITVNYLPKLKERDLTDPNNVIEKFTTTERNFVIPVTVFVGDDGKIKSCFSDIKSTLEMAVAGACDTTNSVYTPGGAGGLGTCVSTFDVRNDAGGVITISGNNYLCPAGQFLQRVVQSGTAPGWRFECKSAVNTVACGPWEYINGIDPATGKATCRDVRNIFTTTGLAVIRSGVYQTVDLDCTQGGTYPSRILQGIDPATGALNCFDAKVALNCPTNQYLSGINFSNPLAPTPICLPVANPTPSCPSGQYLSSVSALGNVTCVTPNLTCAANQYISGVDSNLNAICVTM